MKKLFLALIATTVIFGNSCQSTSNKTDKTNETADTTQTKKATVGLTTDTVIKTEIAKATAIEETAESKATKEMCSCVNSSLKEMSPRVQQLFIRAGNSESPLQVLQNEIVTISDKEQEELMVQLQRFAEDPKLRNCSDNIRKKHGVDTENQASQKKILLAAKNYKDCELVHALLRISFEQQAALSNTN